MKFRSILLGLFAALALSLSVTSCSNSNSDDPYGPAGGNRAAYLLCNGKSQANNGSLSLMYLDADPMTITDHIYVLRNKKQIGDLAQDFIAEDGYFFMTVANSKSLVQMDTQGLIVNRYEFPEADGSPRYMAYYGGKLYVTVWGTGVVVFDAATLQREQTITVGAYPEHIQLWNNKLYVANQSYSPSKDNTVSVINPTTQTKETDITVVENPTNLLVCDGSLYVSSQGNYAEIGSSVQRIDLSAGTYSATEVATGSTVWTDGAKLYMVKVVYDANWNATNEFSIYDPATSQTTPGYFLKGTPEGLETTNFYMFYYDEKTDRYFVGTTDYVNNGDVYVFDGNFNMLSHIDAGGVNPAKMVVVNL